MKRGHGKELTREKSEPTTDNLSKKIVLSDIYLLGNKILINGSPGGTQRGPQNRFFTCTLCADSSLKKYALGNKVDEKG